VLRVATETSAAAFANAAAEAAPAVEPTEVEPKPDKLREMKLYKASEKVRDGVEETLRYMSYPRGHWRRIRTNNMLERLMREIRRRTNVVGCFPDGNSALMLATTRLRHIAGTCWETKRYMSMKRLQEQEVELSATG